MNEDIKDYKYCINLAIQNAKKRINLLDKKEKISILRVYDVDGSTATALLARFLDNLNHPYFYYIPDRE